MKSLGVTIIKVVFGAVILLSVAALINYWFFLNDFNTWKSHPDSSGKIVRLEKAQLFYKIRGSGTPLLVLESGFGSSYTKWDALQTSLAQYGTVLAYDRGDYGFSETANYPRTNATISQELANLLTNENLNGPKILIGHSFGANQIIHDALTLPGPILGLVLIDPGFYDSRNAIASLLNDNRLSSSAKQFIQSVTEENDIFALELAGESGLMYRLYMLQGGGPQDPYFVSIMNASSARYYKALHSEGANDRSVFTAEEKQKLARIPIILITSNHRVIMDQLVQQGLSQTEAQIIADSYQQGKLEYLTLSQRSQFIEANTGEHDVHLIEPELVISAVETILKELGQ